MSKIDIIIVDDHQLFLNALKGLILSFGDFNVITTLKDGVEVVDYFSKENPKPDVVLMDIQMPRMNGIDTTKWLKEHFPDIKVLALSMECEEETILAMLRAGAKGYLLKDIHPSILQKAIQEVYLNGFYYTENVTNTLLNAHKNSYNKPAVELKDKEIEFLKYTCSELTYKEIAEKMFLSPKTIDNYRETLFEKLNVKTRIGLVLYAIKEKIVKL